jgi:hypothetical protein
MRCAIPWLAGVGRGLAIAACVAGFSEVARGNPAVYEVGNDPSVGFNLISWFNSGGSGPSTWQNAVQSMYTAGFRDVSIDPVRFVNISTGEILATSPKGPDMDAISAAVVKAKQLGMRVTLNPFVELFNPHGAGTADDEYFAALPGGCTWRGCWNPTPGSAVSTQFWSSYQSYMVQVAQLAQANHVDAMNVGTELKALDDNVGHNASWTSTIAAIASNYSGPLGYAANWDDYNNANLKTAIWDNPAISYIGIDSYFTNMVTNAQADVSGTYPNASFINTMTSAWNNKLNNEILPYAAARKGGAGMQVAFTELGYLPYNRTSVNPGNSSGALDTDEQRMAFTGLLNALDGQGNRLTTMDIWQWGMPGSNGSLWNINTTAPDQPNNLALAQMLSSYVGTAVYPLAGDFNRDGIVDMSDYVMWRENVGKYVLAYSSADGDGNGVVDANDYSIWRAHFGQVAGSGALAATVPEPASFMIALLAVVATSFRRTRRPVPA